MILLRIEYFLQTGTEIIRYLPLTAYTVQLGVTGVKTVNYELGLSKLC